MIRVEGYMGLGDNVYQRPAIQYLAKEHKKVYLTTPWPQFYHDMENVVPVPAVTQLRTQAMNVRSFPRDHWADPGADKVSRVTRRLFYSSEDQKAGANPVRLFLKSVLAPQSHKFRFELPLLPSWKKQAEGLLDELGILGKPFGLVRPATIRKEYRAPGRNPMPDYLPSLVRERSDLVWISFGWLSGNSEVVADRPIEVDWRFDYGELRIPVIAALMTMAEVTVASVGFVLPLGAALHAPTFIVWGGHIPPRGLVDDSMKGPHLGIVAPEHPCNCIDRLHDCPRIISQEKLLGAFASFMKREAAA